MFDTKQALQIKARFIYLIPSCCLPPFQGYCHQTNLTKTLPAYYPHLLDSPVLTGTLVFSFPSFLISYSAETWSSLKTC